MTRGSSGLSATAPQCHNRNICSVLFDLYGGLRGAAADECFPPLALRRVLSTCSRVGWFFCCRVDRHHFAFLWARWLVPYPPSVVARQAIQWRHKTTIFS